MPKKTAKQLASEINQVLDKFQGVRTGTLVRRSKHWYEQHPGDKKGQLGIVIGRDVYQEGDRLVTYPIIHWEEQASSSGTHPANVEIAPSAFRRALGR
jgi:hypothetical protein